ncbi:MAG TPA: carbonic anhydrase [Fluviicola sp.]|nr:carbonic anhydrase [Fluviicola sp.]
MKVEDVFRNNQEWVNKQLQENPNYFNELAAGQKPNFLFIGCSDSRVSAEILMGAEPGEVFVHRNIANLAPNNDLNVLSVINYAVKFLQVKHIVVCGHYNCGGVKAAMTSSDTGILNPWLRNIRDVYRAHKAELSAIKDEEQRYKRFVELNVYEQCINIIKTRDVQDALAEKSVTIHGWVFDIHSGKIIDLEIDAEKINKEIVDIYRLFD